ncbi:MAG: glycosyltransferase family 2 protein [Solirubrobacterales bacterium]
MTSARQRLFGILLTRDEAPLLRVNILHHLAAGCERVIVIDNGSSDQSHAILRDLARRHPVDWTVEPGPLTQTEYVTAMADEARQKGADWILPLDTDEFWHQPRPYSELLAEAAAAGLGALEVRRYEYVPARDQLVTTTESLLRATWRVETVSFGEEAVNEFVRGERSMFEVEPPRKLLMRTARGLRVGRGAHAAEGLSGPIEFNSEVAILHVPLRSRADLDKRLVHGRRLAAVTKNPEMGVQFRYWQRMADEGRLDEAWRAHSYEDGALEVDGRRVELIEDRTVELLLRPRTVGRPRRALMRLADRLR